MLPTLLVSRTATNAALISCKCVNRIVSPHRHPKVSSKFGSNLDHQRALAGSPGPIIDFFHKFKKVLKEYNLLPENIYNMDEKGFILGVSNRSKFVCKAGRRPPRIAQDGTLELITAIETVSAAQFVLCTTDGYLQGSCSLSRLVY